MTDLNEIQGLQELLGKLFSPPHVAGPATQSSSDSRCCWVVDISLIVKPLTKDINISATLSFLSYNNLRWNPRMRWSHLFFFFEESELCTASSSWLSWWSANETGAYWAAASSMWYSSGWTAWGRLWLLLLRWGGRGGEVSRLRSVVADNVRKWCEVFRMNHISSWSERSPLSGTRWRLPPEQRVPKLYPPVTEISLNPNEGRPFALKRRKAPLVRRQSSPHAKITGFKWRCSSVIPHLIKTY